MLSAAFRGEGRLTIQQRLENILANNGFHLLLPIWRQRGANTHRHFDLAVWGCYKVEKDGKVTDIASWNTMTEIVRARGIAWFEDSTGGIEICAKEMHTAAQMEGK